MREARNRQPAVTALFAQELDDGAPRGLLPHTPVSRQAPSVSEPFPVLSVISPGPAASIASAMSDLAGTFATKTPRASVSTVPTARPSAVRRWTAVDGTPIQSAVTTQPSSRTEAGITDGGAARTCSTPSLAGPSPPQPVASRLDKMADARMNLGQMITARSPGGPRAGWGVGTVGPCRPRRP